MIETYTLACCKSPDTSARVTVTNFTRGSRSSNRIVSLATSRTASATRARRWVFMMLYFHLVIEQFRHRMPTQGRDDLLESRANVLRLVADHRHSQHNKLAMILRLYLGHRHVKIVTQAVFYALYHLALVLQAARLAKQQSHTERTDDHNQCRIQNAECRMKNRNKVFVLDSAFCILRSALR